VPPWIESVLVDRAPVSLNAPVWIAPNDDALEIQMSMALPLATTGTARRL
jgi:hypothetical protein